MERVHVRELRPPPDCWTWIIDVPCSSQGLAVRKSAAGREAQNVVVSQNPGPLISSRLATELGS